MRSVARAWEWGLLCALSGAACRESGPLPAGWPACPATPAPANAAVTWHEHVAPILAARCAPCHGETGLALPRLDAYASGLAATLQGVVAAGGMPPWPAGRCCGTYAHAAGLTGEELGLVAAWDGAEGNPDAPGLPLPQAPPLSRVDATLDLPAYDPAFTGDPQVEARCFVLAWDRPTAMVTGFDVLPNRRAGTLLSVAVLGVPAVESDRFEALDAASAGAGWACPEGLGDDHQYLVGTWSPHFKACNFPEGVGIALPSEGSLVARVMFRPPDAAPDAAPGGEAPEPQLRFKLDPPAALVAEAIRIPFTNPFWLVKGGLTVPAGAPEASAWFQADPSYHYASGKPYLIHAVVLGMGERGTRATLSLVGRGGARTCLLHVDPWDPRFPLQYYLQKPVRVAPGEELHLECHWSNPSDRDLHWGAESCIGMLLVTP